MVGKDAFSEVSHAHATDIYADSQSFQGTTTGGGKDDISITVHFPKALLL